MKKIGLLLALALCGCGPRVSIERSPILYEDAIVYDLIFTPPAHMPSTKTEYQFGPYYNWMEGEFEIGFHPAQVPCTITIPPKYGVVFKCQHGKFYIEREILYKTLQQGQRVNIQYQELYHITTEKIEGEWRETKHELYDYDFLNAFPADRKVEKE